VSGDAGRQDDHGTPDHGDRHADRTQQGYVANPAAQKQCLLDLVAHQLAGHNIYHCIRNTARPQTEAQVFQICARAGVACIGIQRGFGIAPDFVLFQPTVTTLAVRLAAFADPDKAVELIKAKLSKAGAP
jgi:hypothetical protein